MTAVECVMFSDYTYFSPLVAKILFTKYIEELLMETLISQRVLQSALNSEKIKI